MNVPETRLPKTTWRYTAEPIMLLFVDGRALIFGSIWFLYPAWWTFAISSTGVLVFSILGWFRITPAIALRIMRVWWFGPIRPHIPAYRQRDAIR